MSTEYKTLGGVLEARKLTKHNSNVETLATAMEAVAKAEDKVLKLMEEIDALTVRIMEASENAGDLEDGEAYKILGEAYKIGRIFDVTVNVGSIADGAISVDKLVTSSLNADSIRAGSIAAVKLSDWRSNDTVAVAGGSISGSTVKASRIKLD